MNNLDIKQAILDMKRAADEDKYGGVRRYIQTELYKQGLIDFLPRIQSLDDPIPEAWCAAQVTIFDNGEVTKGRKRAYVEKTKVRFGGNVKFWTRHGSERIDFRREAQIDWQATLYLWPRDMALKVLAELKDDRDSDQATIELFEQAIESSDEDAMFAIPRRATGEGSRWSKSHIVVIRPDGDSFRGGIFHPTSGGGMAMIELSEFDTQLHTGKPLGGKAVAMCRVARSDDFAGWATELQLD